MELTKEQIEQQKASYIQQRDALTNQIAAYNGAIQDCDYWLEQLKVSPPPEQQPPS
jgi:hypothetical protein